MPKNDFKAFAISENANVLKQTEYELLPALDEGFQSGIARSEELNKVWRQASTITSVIASFMANKSGQDVLDNGDLNTLQNTLLKALLNNSTSQLDDRYLNAELNLSDINDAKAACDNLGLTQTVELAAGALQKDKNLSDVPDKAKARVSLELVKQTSSTDKTSGAVLLNGAWGLGTNSIGMLNSDILSPTSIGNAFFSQGGGDKNNHFGGYGAGIHLSYGIGASGTQRMTANLFIDSAGNLSVEWLAVNISDGNVATQGIQKLYGPLNKPSAGDVGAIPFFGQIPAGTNLNTLTNYGVWFNPANANATLALNYPSTQAGSLQVLQDAGTTQIYTEYAGGRQFRRGLYTNNWSAWVVVYDSKNPPPVQDLSQYIKTSDADNRYIQNTQMGAEEYVDIPFPGQADLPFGACPTAYVGATKPTGGGVGFYISRVYFRRLQKYIGGSWVNVA